MLANELAEVIANSPSAVVPVGGLWRKFLRLGRGSRPLQGANLFDRADANSIRFSQRPIDGASFGNAHFGALDQVRNVGGVGIAITDKAATGFALMDSSFESPALCRWVAKRLKWLNVDASAPITPRQSD